MSDSTIILITILSLTSGIVGYLCFHENMPELYINIEKPPHWQTDYMMDFAQILLSLNLFVGLTLNFYPLR